MKRALDIVNKLIEDEGNSPADKILAVIHKGPIRAIGGIVYDVDMKPLMNTTDLHGAIQALAQREIVIHRIDSGGSPTWDVVPSVAHMNAMPAPRPPRKRCERR